MSAEQGDVEALEWLARSRDSKSPSVAKVHATTLLTRFDRLVAALERAERERDDALGERVIAQLDIAQARAEKAERALAESETRMHSLHWLLGLENHEGEEPTSEEDAVKNLRSMHRKIVALRPSEDTSDES